MKSMKSIYPWQSVIQTINEIIKSHGGELSIRIPSEKVETKPGEGAKFLVQLPLV
jgi:hypothetical protein